MLTLHYAIDNASLIVRLALEESGLAYRTVEVDRDHGALETPQFRALNPAGRIPVLETPDGPVFETGAILLWLADRSEGQAPGAADPARGDLLKWLFFLANTAHADLIQVFYPERYVTPEGRAGHRALITERLRGHYALLDAAAAANPGLFAPPSILAAYACTLLRWSVLYPGEGGGWVDLAAYPALHGLAVALDARPATQRAAAAEALGDRPFSAPAM